MEQNLSLKVSDQQALPLDDGSASFVDRQWYLGIEDAHGGPAKVDLNISDVWRDYTGRGVAVGIWDDGIDYDHWDLRENYDSSRHISIDGRIHDPIARGTSKHGTPVAGIIAATENGAGVTGVAHGASVTGVDILSPYGTSISASFKSLLNFDVTNHSWGFVYPMGGRDPAFADMKNSLYDSSVNGRGGLGTINVFSAGNKREDGAHTNSSGLTSLSHTIAVGAVGYDGFVTYYSTPGSGLLVSAPSGDRFGDPEIWTTDRTGFPGYSPGLYEGDNTDPDFTSGFSGTSAAAPMVTGVVALMLEANPLLGWRDVQEILAHTAVHVGTQIGGAPTGDELHTWGFNAASTWNGGGLHYSNDYGFGLVDARAAVRVAETWTLQQSQANRFAGDVASWTGFQYLPDGSGQVSISFSITTEMDVESVSVDLGFYRSRVSDYRVTLTSPSGTESVLATPRANSSGNSNGFFLSKEFWGEDPIGNWTLTVKDELRNFSSGWLQKANLWFGGGQPTGDDVYVFTDEFSDYVGRYGHSSLIKDIDGGANSINAAAVTAGSVVDLARGTGKVDGIEVRFVGAFDSVFTGDGADRIIGSTSAEMLGGGRGHDFIKGGAGADRLFGGADNDELFGGGGGDRLFGGKGSDRIVDGAGFDRLFGGNGADTFVFASDGSADRIGDFRNGVDTIEILSVGFRDLEIDTIRKGLVSISFHDEVLVVSDGGIGKLTASDFDRGDFVFV